MTPYGVIYLVIHRESGKYYIGQTIHSAQYRWGKHCGSARCGSQLYFHRAITKYGREAFDVETIAEANSKDELNALESIWVIVTNTKHPDCGYNLKDGGNASATPKGVPWSPARREADRLRRERGAKNKPCPPISEHTRELMRANSLGRKQSPETLAKQRLIHLGSTRSLETKKKMSVAQSGVNHPAFGKTRSDEAKQKTTASLLQFYSSNSKPPVTDATRERMRTSRKAYFDRLALQKAG